MVSPTQLCWRYHSLPRRQQNGLWAHKPSLINICVAVSRWMTIQSGCNFAHDNKNRVNRVFHRISTIDFQSQFINPCEMSPYTLNKLSPRQNGRHFPDDIFKRIFLNLNVWINISLKLFLRGSINNILLTSYCLLTHICITWPKWVNNTSNHHCQYGKMTNFSFPHFDWNKNFSAIRG